MSNPAEEMQQKGFSGAINPKPTQQVIMSKRLSAMFFPEIQVVLCINRRGSDNTELGFFPFY